MLLYDSLNLIIIHQSHLGCWGHRSEKAKLRGLDYVAYNMRQCAVLLKNKIIICNVFGGYEHSVEMVTTLIMLSLICNSCLMKKNFHSSIFYMTPWSLSFRPPSASNQRFRLPLKQYTRAYRKLQRHKFCKHIQRDSHEALKAGLQNCRFHLSLKTSNISDDCISFLVDSTRQ